MSGGTWSESQGRGPPLIRLGPARSLALYRQANARLRRQGRKDTVAICRIVSAHMMDEDVIKALNRKDTTETDCRG